MSITAFDFDKEEYIHQLINSLKDHINKLIINSPEIIEPVIVYRGIKTSYFIYDYETDPDSYFLYKGFIITSLIEDIASDFSEETRNEMYIL